jgi:acyl carrier protein
VKNRARKHWFLSAANAQNIIYSALTIAQKIRKDKKWRRKIRMPGNLDIKGIVRHVAEVTIGELKLEDVTADTFNPDMDLVEELGIDSMDLATIALVLQDEYKIVIDEDDYPKLKTIRLIADYIKEKLAARS